MFHQADAQAPSSRWLEISLETSQATLTALENQVADLWATQQELENALATAQSAQTEASLNTTGQPTTLAAELRQVQSELAQAQQQAQASQQQLQSLTEQKAMAEDLYSQAQAEVSDLQVKNAVLEEQSTVSQTALSTAENRFRALEQQANEADQVLRTVTAENVALERQIVTVNADRDRLAEALQQTKQTAEQLENQVNRLQTALASTSLTKPSEQADPQGNSGEDRHGNDGPAVEEATAELAESSVKGSETVAQTELAPETEQSPSTGNSQPLAGKSVVITGRLSMLSSQQAEKLIVEAGGKVTKMPSSKTGYIVVGDNPGSKLQKAAKQNVPQLNEAELLALLGLSPENM